MVYLGWLALLLDAVMLPISAGQGTLTVQAAVIRYTG